MWPRRLSCNFFKSVYVSSGGYEQCCFFFVGLEKKGNRKPNEDVFSRLALYFFVFRSAGSSFKSSRRFESRKIKLMIFT